MTEYDFTAKIKPCTDGQYCGECPYFIDETLNYETRCALSVVLGLDDCDLVQDNTQDSEEYEFPFIRTDFCKQNYAPIIEVVK